MNKVKITINFDMDGTIADLYGVDNWLEMLTDHDPTPYEIARPLVRLNVLARMLNNLHKNGYRLAVISWLSKSGTDDYNAEVEEIKLEWLEKHLPSVHWDEINIVKYGTPKEMFCGNPLDILFDDEEHNRENWNGRAFDVNDIFGVLKNL